MVEQADPIQARARLVVSLLLAAAFLGIGAALGIVGYATRVEPPRREASAPAPRVDLLIIEPRDIAETWEGYGTARAFREAHVPAQVSAAVVERGEDIRPGAVVEGGQALFRLDEREFRLSLQRIEAEADAQRAALREIEAENDSLVALIRTAELELRVAADERDRLAGLLERDLAVKREYDLANLAYQQARRTLQAYQREADLLGPRRARATALLAGLEADAARARLNVERCKIRAPFSGQLLSVDADVGDAVSPGVVVSTLVDATRLDVEIQLPASAYALLRVGAFCRLEREGAAATSPWDVDRAVPEVESAASAAHAALGHPGRQRPPSWVARVERISPVVDRSTRTFRAYAVVDNTTAAHRLAPGMFVRAVVEGPRLADGILVPRSAFRLGRLFVAEDGVARVRPVVIDRMMKDHVLVREGLRAGDAVILRPSEQLAEGSPVQIRSTRNETGEPRLSASVHETPASP